MANRGFSIIQLSVVLIFIAIIIAGLVIGTNMLDSIRMQSFLDELEGYRQNTHLMATLKKECPGI